MQNEVPEGSPAAPDAPARASRLSRFRAAILSNKLFTLALAAGAIVRLITVLGYPGLLVFQGDTYVYIGAALRLQPNLSKTTGYSLYLKALEPLHSFTLVMITQHLMGLAMALMLYALLRRARVRAWIATLATVPILFNGFEIQLEHMVMADLLFEFCMFAAATLLLWNRRPSWRQRAVRRAADRLRLHGLERRPAAAGDLLPGRALAAAGLALAGRDRGRLRGPDPELRDLVPRDLGQLRPDQLRGLLPVRPGVLVRRLREDRPAR